MLKSALVFLGAGGGGLLRYWLGLLVQGWWGRGFPLGTLLINLTGCLVIGFLGSAWYGPAPVRDELRLLVLVGVLGGYTTFSSFGRETILLAQQGEWAQAGLYVGLSVVVGIVCVWLGVIAAGWVFGGAKA
ncbi:MAG: fluoride efflux transporter CrcB [Tepidisphaera sp.]|nr:fluoride efflux transporter CrcB [Tepidisphaera sp.]